MAGDPRPFLFPLVRETRLDGDPAALHPGKKGARNVRVGGDLRRLMGLNKFIRDIAGQRPVLFIQKVIVDENPRPDIGMISEGRLPDEFRFPDEFPHLIRAPLMDEDFNF